MKTIQDYIKKYDLVDAIWDHKQSRKKIIKHKALERIATGEGISFNPPTVVEAHAADRIAVVIVEGVLGDRNEWSFGEAAPYNYRWVEGKASGFPYAMAEKRAKDRVILKFLNLHGDFYSEEEADVFRKPTQGTTTTPASKSNFRFKK